MGISGREVAVKTLKGFLIIVTILYHKHILSGYFDQLEVDKFVEESLKMSRFKHPHVMGLIGVCLDAGTAPYIVMPYMANGNLLQYLKKERDNLVFPEDIEEAEVNVFFCNQINTYICRIDVLHRCRMFVNV